MRDPISQIAAEARALEPLSTALPPSLPRLPGITTVAFDIYGTLVISGSGDIGLTDAEDQSSILHDLLEKIGARHIPDNPAARFRALIEDSHQRSRSEGTEFPEVEIVEIWRAFLADAGAENQSRDTLEAMATAYEMATNPVWPMPGARETITALREAGRTLGIVSNAQFYTPLLFEAFWETSVSEMGFSPDLCFYSYQFKEAKPGLSLYQRLATALAEKGLEASQTLYVGNDMLKDVHPAAELGFRTALFAGDQRSLRLREDRTDLNQPDAVITELPQILEIIG